MRNQELVERLQTGRVREVTFDDFSALLEERGFRFDRESGEDWIFVHPSMPGTVGVKAREGKIQAFQALYLLRVLERHGPR